MGLKISYQWLYTKATETTMHGLTEVTKKYLKKVARPDTEIVIRYPERSTGNVRSAYLEYLNTLDVIEGVIQAEREGYDASIIGCFSDPGLQVAREVVNIPVVATCESSVHIASMLGDKFAIITNTPIFVPGLLELLRQYGVESKAISRNPVRWGDYIFPTDFVEGIRDPYKSLIPKFEKLSLECIEDGADVIIPGCTQEFAFAKVGYKEIGETGVTVVYPIAITVKMAELLADLNKSIGLSKSKAEHSPYGKRNMELIKSARIIYGLEK